VTFVFEDKIVKFRLKTTVKLFPMVLFAFLVLVNKLKQLWILPPLMTKTEKNKTATSGSCCRIVYGNSNFRHPNLVTATQTTTNRSSNT